MAGILPIPIGRTSDLLVSSRLRQQLQSDQLSLLQVQTQVSTGRRLISPSDDAPAAARAVTLQRLLEQKSQVRTNLETSRSYLSSTENALSNVSQLLAEVRGEALAAADTTRADADRVSAAQTVDATINQLLDVANHKFRGRYLFTGTNTEVRPFEYDGTTIKYNGNEGQLRSYSDIDLLFETNRTGNEVFGAISGEVRGTVDLNPNITANTKLSQLRGGRGIGVGSIVISDGTNSSTIDISGAETVGDLVNRLEASPPAGNGLIVRLSPTGLDIQLQGSGNLAIREVGSGTTANELGILTPALGIGNERLVGEDLNPLAVRTTRLNEVVGVRARTLIESVGANNDIVLQAIDRGEEFNGYRVQFVDDQALQAASGLLPGSEVVHVGSETSLHARASLTLLGADNDLLLTAVDPGADLNHVTIRLEAVTALGDAANASYDAANKTLTLQVDASDATQLSTLVTAIEDTGLFNVTPDASAGEGFDPAASVLASNAGLVTGNTSGSGGDEKTIFVHINPGGSSAAQVVAALNADSTVSTLFTAELDSKDLLSNAIPGTAPIELATSGTTSFGAGEEFDRDSGIQITNAGETFVIDVSQAETIEDLLNLFNGSAANVVAQLKADGTGIDVRSRLSGADFSIGENGGRTATQLGIRSFSGATAVTKLDYGRGLPTAEGTDFTIRRSDGSELEIDLTGTVTVDDILARINDHADNQDPATAVVARLTDFGNGIELVADNSLGSEPLTVIRDPASDAAYTLGLVPSGAAEQAASQPAAKATATVDTSVLNSALTIEAVQAGIGRNDVRIVFEDSLVGDQANVVFNPNSGELTVQLDSTQTTANTVAQAINDQGLFTAALATGIDLTNDGSGLIASSLSGFPAEVAATASGTAERIASAEIHPVETTSTFNTLLRLRDALQANDFREIERNLSSLDRDLDRLNFVRADLGAKERSLDTHSLRLDTEEIELRATLSIEIEVDFVEAISNLTARQASTEASLRVIGQLAGLTLLNFI